MAVRGLKGFGDAPSRAVRAGTPVGPTAEAEDETERSKSKLPEADCESTMSMLTFTSASRFAMRMYTPAGIAPEKLSGTEPFSTVKVWSIPSPVKLKVQIPSPAADRSPTRE